ncbi:sigma-54-dependent transcriptional regulator [Tepidimonas charontis]|uniref:Luminescence regulatory protein LuxO n=1 Tax=Tepidimonas charontis TaxID=2267262 RepID=A0A554XDF4_9BURK|nr:sigma-54 dependent transcriptional regulator [Tepidimonas charontis]TSE33863.1 Luminescence regulatory protein LuxO [Tepidimonas charontis]
MTSSPALLIVEDEPDLRQLYQMALVKVGLDVDAVGDLAQARQRLAQRRYAAVLTDMRLPDGTGLELLRELAAARRGERALVITAYGSADNAVEALKAGAFDYLTKPVTPARLRQAIGTALAAARGADAAASAVPPHRGQAGADDRPGPSGPDAEPALAPGDAAGSAAASTPAALQRLVGASAAMQAVRATIARVARTMAPVLITGESGTGKELIARALHACSHRASGPFVAVNCGAIPAELLESELFGHRRGAFTGASSDKPGLFQAAAGGTLFLDEVADLPLPMQVKLLRALQERAVRPVGATAEEAVDVRIVSATHKDLARLVQSGHFRHDLYYRLNVIPIHAPALRAHIEDLPAIAAAILQQLARRDGWASAPTLTAAAVQRLQRHPFPGNVRELENLLERALALHPGPALDADAFDLPASLAAPAGGGPAHHGPFPAASGAATASQGEQAATPGHTPQTDAGGSAEPAAPGTPGVSDAATAPLPRAQLEALLQRNRWNQSRTARELGWTLAKLRYWMQRLGLA